MARIKAITLIFFASFALLFLISGTAKAVIINNLTCDESNGGTNGLVPCGRMCVDDNGNQVTCGTPICGTNHRIPCYTLYCRCELSHVFILIKNIYSFIVFYIATPLAVLLVVIGGIMLLVSGGSPGLASMGKNTIKWAIIALLLIFGSWLIIDVLLKAIGYNGPWWSF